MAARRRIPLRRAYGGRERRKRRILSCPAATNPNRSFPRRFYHGLHGLHGCDSCSPSPFPIREIREIRGSIASVADGRAGLFVPFCGNPQSAIRNPQSEMPPDGLASATSPTSSCMSTAPKPPGLSAPMSKSTARCSKCRTRRRWRCGACSPGTAALPIAPSADKEFSILMLRNRLWRTILSSRTTEGL